MIKQHIFWSLKSPDIILGPPPKSGRRPRARVLAGGLRLVTEGYRCSPPLPPTLGTTDAPVIYSVSCVCVRYKKHCVLQGFGPLGGREFHLGDVKKRI